VQPEDFWVEEQLGFEPAGSGSHALLRVRKRGCNTEWVARELARHGGCRVSEVGFAGLKDRHAVAIQWYSAPLGRAGIEHWQALRGAEFEVLEAHLHARKLPRGALQGNQFRIRVRALRGDPAAVGARLEALRARGVPNYFGPQRFGRDAANLRRLGHIAAVGSGAHRGERAFALSSARSLIFNAVLAERVEQGSWGELLPGDIANLDGRGSIFAVDALTAELVARAERLEIHPTGPLWGRGPPPSGGATLERERRIAELLERPCELTVRAGMRQERRSLRLAVRELSYVLAAGELELAFSLTRGGYATAVLREIMDVMPELAEG
jgi:tRNA pseudouridine13 synthase